MIPNSGSSSRYVTHARTLPELRDEFLSDIARRQSLIDLQIKHSPSARRSATLAAIRQEFDSMAEFWSTIELRSVKSREQP